MNDTFFCILDKLLHNQKVEAEFKITSIMYIYMNNSNCKENRHLSIFILITRELINQYIGTIEIMQLNIHRVYIFNSVGVKSA